MSRSSLPPRCPAPKERLYRLEASSVILSACEVSTALAPTRSNSWLTKAQVNGTSIIFCLYTAVFFGRVFSSFVSHSPSCLIFDTAILTWNSHHPHSRYLVPSTPKTQPTSALSAFWQLSREQLQTHSPRPSTFNALEVFRSFVLPYSRAIGHEKSRPSTHTISYRLIGVNSYALCA